MRIQAVIITLIFSILLAACTATPDTAPIPRDALVTQKRQDLAISEVSQSMNVASNAAWANLHAILDKYKLRIERKNEREGDIETDWTPITDYLCGAYGRSKAPMNCDVRFWFSVTPISGVSSMVKIRYEEVCQDVPGGKLECPNSNAERLMLAIAADIEAAAGISRED